MAHFRNRSHWQCEAASIVNTQISSVHHFDRNCVTESVCCEAHSIFMPEDSCFLNLYVLQTLVEVPEAYNKLKTTDKKVS